MIACLEEQVKQTVFFYEHLATIKVYREENLRRPLSFVLDEIGLRNNREDKAEEHNTNRSHSNSAKIDFTKGGGSRQTQTVPYKVLPVGRHSRLPAPGFMKMK
jgi:hypothetical protein